MRSSRSVFCVALCSVALPCGIAIANAQADRSFRTQWRSGDDQLEINIQAAAFKREDHKIEQRNGRTFVDGRRAIGIDGAGQIETEIKTFTVLWNGKRVPLPKAAYAPLFNFSLQKAEFFPGEMGELLVTKSFGGDALLFIFANGSGSVRQWVWLVVARDGKWFRFEADDGESPL